MIYRDANNIEHESYTAACVYYGVDTPAQIEAEMAAELEEWMDWCSEHDLFDDIRENGIFIDCPF